MIIKRFCVLLLSFGAVLPSASFAQGVDVGISGVDLVSIQPVNDGLIGGPYLDEGLGGVGRGWGAGVNVITPAGFVVAGEFNTARYDLIMHGRFVGDSGDRNGPHPTRWRTSMLSGLIGYAKSAGHNRVLFLGGVSKTLGTPMVDEREFYTTNDETEKVVITGGLDVSHTFAARATLVINGRYSFVKRENLIYLGMGPHVLRIGVGLRVRIN